MRTTTLLLSGLFVFFGFFIIFSPSVHAAAGDIYVTATREGDSAAIAGATVAVQCTGGAYTDIGTTDAGGVAQAAAPGGADCQNGEDLYVRVTKDGYVEVTPGTPTAVYSSTADPNNIAITGIQFAYQITGVSTEAPTTVITSSVTIFRFGNSSGTDNCYLITGVWHCPVTTIHSTGSLRAEVELDGYIKKTDYAAAGTNRTSNSDAQVTATVTGVQYSHKLTVTDSSSSPVSGATVRNDLGGPDQVTYNENGTTGVYYAAIPIAKDNKTVTISKTGWVTNTNTISGDRTGNFDAQQAQTNATLVQTGGGGSVDTTSPGPVTNFTATDTGEGGSVNLAWINPTDADLQQVRVHRATSGSDFTLTSTNQVAVVTGVGVGASHTHKDTGLTNGTLYWYKVRTEDTSGNIQGGLIYPTASATPTAPPASTENTTDVTPTTGGEATATTTDNTTARVTLPSGSVTEQTTVKVEPLDKTSVQTEIARLPATKTVVGTNVFDLTAKTATGTEVRTFNQTLTLTFTYTDAQVIGLDENTLEIHYYDETTQAWLSLPSTVNTATKTITATTTHFTRFAIVAAADVTPPTAPGSIAVSEIAAGSLKLSWTNPSSDFHHIKIYRSVASGTLGSVLVNDITAVTYIDVSVQGGTLYYYTVRAVDPAGNESTNTAQVSTLSSGTGIKDGDLIRATGTFDIYIVKLIGQKKFKRLILNPAIFESYGHLRWEDVKDVNQAVVDSYVGSQLVIEVNPDGSVADPKVYKISSAPDSDVGQRSWLNMSAGAFEAAGYDWDALYRINHTEASPSFYPLGTAITS